MKNRFVDRHLRKPKAGPIKVIVVDDHPVTIEGVCAMLAQLPEQFRVIATAFSGEDVQLKAQKSPPNVIVMDMNMPGIDGLEATRRIKHAHPEIKVLIFSEREDAQTANDVIRAGAEGCLRKSATATELRLAIERIHNGESFFSKSMAATFFEDYVKRGGREVTPTINRISEREHQVLHLIVGGAANKEAADTLKISVRTVEKHRQRIMRKLGVHKATELVRFAITKGMVNVGAY